MKMIDDAEQLKTWIAEHVKVQNLNLKIEVFNRPALHGTGVIVRAEFWYRILLGNGTDKAMGSNAADPLHLPVSEDDLPRFIRNLVTDAMREAARQMVVFS